MLCLKHKLKYLNAKKKNKNKNHSVNLLKLEHNKFFFFSFIINMFIFKSNLIRHELCIQLLLLLIDLVMVSFLQIIDIIRKNNKQIQKCFHWKWFHVDSEFKNVMKRPNPFKSIQNSVDWKKKKKKTINNNNNRWFSRCISATAFESKINRSTKKGTIVEH